MKLILALFLMTFFFTPSLWAECPANDPNCAEPQNEGKYCDQSTSCYPHNTNTPEINKNAHSTRALVNGLLAGKTPGGSGPDRDSGQ